MPPSKILSDIPAIVYAGDTLYFCVPCSSYPASLGWVMVYEFGGTDAPEAIESTANGDSHLFNITSTVTGIWNAGDYTWRSYVQKTTSTPQVPERYSITSGTISIRTADYQSPAKKRIDAIESYLNGTTAYADYEWTMKTLGDMSVSRGGDPRKNAREDLAYWKSVYAGELQKEKLMNGQETNNRTIWTRFTRN